MGRRTDVDPRFIPCEIAMVISIIYHKGWFQGSSRMLHGLKGASARVHSHFRRISTGRFFAHVLRTTSRNQFLSMRQFCVLGASALGGRQVRMSTKLVLGRAAAGTAGLPTKARFKM